MVTRVSCGHGGRALVADNIVWTLYGLLQLAVGLRVAGAIPGASAAPLVGAVLLWPGVMTIWGLRLMSWYGRERVDGRPG